MNREFVKADTEKDKARFLQVLESANQRTAEKGEAQWLPCHLTAEAVFGEGVEPWMLLEEGVPAAVVLLVQEDPVSGRTRPGKRPCTFTGWRWPRALRAGAWPMGCWISPHPTPESWESPFCGWTARPTGKSCVRCTKPGGSGLWTCGSGRAGRAPVQRPV